MSRNHALSIFRAALRAADPAQAVSNYVKLSKNSLRVSERIYALSKFDRIRIVGAGKASAKMAQALENLLGKRVHDGWVNVPEGTRVSLKRVKLHEAGHPVPNEAGMQGAQAIAQIAQESGDRDLILAVISGGASALLPLPGTGVTLDQKKSITKQLLASGATIHEMNAVRKHMSAIKGGRLGELAYPATVVALILSDVIGDDLDAIGSGPTVGDSKTVEDARRILKHYGIAAPALTETPKPGSKSLSRVQNAIIGSNRQSVDAAAKEARRLGYKPLVLSTMIDGETREIARMHAAIAKEVLKSGNPVRRPACMISGGETTVTIRGTGTGGRNQEFVLAAAMALDGAPVEVFSGGTDGSDGPTDAAGAFADAKTLARARALGLSPADYLDGNDSYHFFEQAGGLIKTGVTGTNVMDVRLLLL